MYYLFFNDDLSGMFFFFLCIFCLFLSVFEGLLFDFAITKATSEATRAFGKVAGEKAIRMKSINV
jgi:hypothetical protein